jgi:hypothetical protein
LFRPLEPLAPAEHSEVVLDVRPTALEQLAPATAEELAGQSAAHAELVYSMRNLPVCNPADGWDSNRADEMPRGWEDSLRARTSVLL